MKKRNYALSYASWWKTLKVNPSNIGGHYWKRDVLEYTPICITIDKEAKGYLLHMYGPADTSIDEVSKLPLKVSDIYRRITS